MIDIRDHGMGGGTGNSNLTNTLRYTVSITQPSSPQKGDVWINTSTSYSNISIVQRLPSTINPTTLYIIVNGVYGTVDTTKLNSQLNTSNITGYIEFNVMRPNSDQITSYNTNIFKQGNEIKWYGTPYKAYINSVEQLVYSYSGTTWVKMGYVLYFYNGSDRGIYEYKLGDNKVTKKTVMNTYYLDVNNSLKPTLSIAYDKINNSMWYGGTDDTGNNYYMNYLSFNSYTTTRIKDSDSSYCRIFDSKIIIDNDRGCAYYVEGEPNGYFQILTISKVSLTTGKVLNKVYFNSKNSSSYNTSDFGNPDIFKKGNLLWIYMKNYKSGHKYVAGYIALDTFQYVDLYSLSSTASYINGIILDIDNGNSQTIIYGMCTQDDSGSKLYKYDYTSGVYTKLQDVPFVGDDINNQNFRRINETNTRVYFCCQSKVRSFFFYYDKVNKTVTQISPSNGVMRNDYFSYGANTNIFADEGFMFSIISGKINYFDIITGTVYNTFDLSPLGMVNGIYPLFVSQNTVN